MASCGEDSGQGSDCIHDFSCTKCEKGNKASHVCPVCKVFYCVQCLQFLCAHGSPDVSRWTVASSSAASEVDCWRHPGRPIQTYCGKHDVVCCSLCSARSHRGCQTTAIKDVDSSSATEDELKKTQEEIESVREEINQLKCSKRSHQSTLGQSREEAEKEVRDYCDSLRDKLDTLEKATLDELAATFETQNRKLQSDIEVCEHMENDIAQLSQQENETIPGSTIGFSRIKRDNEWLKENQILLYDIGNNWEKKKLKIILDASLETTLSSYHDIGRLDTVMCTWKARNKNEFNVKDSSETRACHIMNIVQMADGTFVVADIDRASVKQLDGEYGLISFCRINHQPKDICSIGDSEVAVSLSNNTIQFITVRNGLHLAHSISLSHACRGVAHRHGKLYVTDEAESLYVYRLSGTKLQTFNKDKNGEKLFQRSYRIAFSKDGNLIYITDRSQGLVTLDKNGNKVSFRKIESADGVCVAEDGSVFVSQYGPHNVVQVTQKGDVKMADVMVKSDGVNPHGICIDKQKGKLLVAQCTTDELCVFDLVKEYTSEK